MLTDVPTPSIAPGEALVRVTAASINPVDVHISSGRFFDGPPVAPYVPGLEAVGVVEQGSALAPGTRVRVEIVHPGYGRDGALAEYVVVPEIPDNARRASQAQVFAVGDDLSDAYLAAVGASGCTALSLLDRVRETGGRIEGANVLVLAATGSVGSILIQLAKRMGAARVIGAGRDGSRLQKLAELGADATVQIGDDEAAMQAAVRRGVRGPARHRDRATVGCPGAGRHRCAQHRRSPGELRQRHRDGDPLVGAAAAQQAHQARGLLRSVDHTGAAKRAPTYDC